MKNKLTILTLCAFSVYCGSVFTERKYKKIAKQSGVEWQERVDSVKAVHSNLLLLHRKHIDDCRFKYSK